jgi:exodeoxyribonuclease X
MKTSGWTPDEMAISPVVPRCSPLYLGKYRGKPVSEVAERDPGYLRWLFNNDNMSPELRLTLKHYLDHA